MVPNVSKNGKSFRGAGAYYLHDKDKPGAENDNARDAKPTTDDRVAFIDTRNLVNDDPDLAIDEMWATAAMQEALKEVAGIKRGGRKCDDPVKSVSLSWHPSETPTPDQMIEAADKYLKQMGWSEHQALIIGHNDTDHLHVHLLINRVHPETGRTLNDWQDEKRSQAWALDYEKEMGHIWCHKRVEPVLAMDLNVPRPAFEAAREPVEKFVAAELSKEDLDKLDRANLKADQRAERVAFFEDGQTAFKELRSEIYTQVREEFRPEWRDYYKDKNEREGEAEEASKTAMGRALFFAKTGDMDKAWEAFGDRDSVRDAVAKEFDDRREELRSAQVAETRERQAVALDALRIERDDTYKELLERQSGERAELKATHALGERPTDRRDPQTERPANENQAPDIKLPDAAAKAPTVTLDAPAPSAEIRLPDQRPEDSRPVDTPTVEPLIVLPEREHADVRQADRNAGDMATGMADLGAGGIGAAANYLADQLGELFAPTPPEVRAAEAKAMAKAEAERPPEPEKPKNPYLQHAAEAENKAQVDKDEQVRDEYWQERARERDR